jgi:DNA-binding response OmpR family regulator
MSYSSGGRSQGFPSGTGRHLAPEQGGGAPVIALTGRSDAEERGKALEAGFARFLTKPVDLEQLLHEICSLLEPGDLAGIN